MIPYYIYLTIADVQLDRETFKRQPELFDQVSRDSMFNEEKVEELVVNVSVPKMVSVFQYNN